MIVAQILLIGAALFVALFYFGFGLTRWLLPANFVEWRGLMTPLVGLAVIMVWDYVALFFGINLTIATLLLLGVATIANGAAIWQYRRSTRVAALTPSRASLVVLGIAFVVFIAATAPLMRYGYITIIGENWDYEFYLPLADALRTLPTSALSLAPSNPLMNVILSRHIFPLPMGFSYLQGSLDILLGLDAIDSFAILLALVRALGVVSAFIFFRATFGMTPRVSLAAAAWLGLNGLLLWATYWNFGLHLTSLTLLPLAVTFGAHALRQMDKARTAGSPLPLAALCLAALNVTFHPTLVAALLPLGALGLWLVLTRRERMRILARGAGLLLLTVALSFPVLFHLPDFQREYYGREPLATGLRDFIPLTDGYGLSQYSLDLVVGHTIPTPALYDIALRTWNFAAPVFFMVAVALSAFALWQRRNDTAHRALWYLIVGASIFFSAVFRLPFLHPYPYGFLKSLTLVSFVLIGLTAQGLESLYILSFSIPRLRSAKAPCASWFISPVLAQSSTLVRLVAIGFGLLTLFTCAVTLEQYFKPAPPFFNANDLQLRAAAHVPPRDATIWLTDRTEVQKIPMGLAAYALREYDLHGEVETGYGNLNNAAPGAVYDYALLARGQAAPTLGYSSTALWQNQKFALYAKAPGVVYHSNVSAELTTPLTRTIGANGIISGTAAISSTIATRGVSLALATFVTQTVTVTLGSSAQTLSLSPGLTLYSSSPIQLPTTLTITPELPSGLLATAPDNVTRSDLHLFVPYVELREVGGKEDPQVVSAAALLVGCAHDNDRGLNTYCTIANPIMSMLRWEWVVRGMPRGTHEDQELIRRAMLGSPRQSITLTANVPRGLSAIQFDHLSPQLFPADRALPDGSYRAALEIFRDNVLLADLALYQFTIVGSTLTRVRPSDSSLMIVQP